MKSLSPNGTTGSPVSPLNIDIRMLLETFDWGQSALGPRRDWSEALKVAVQIVLAAKTPMCLLAGPQGILIYNDGYARIAAGKHPEIFGMAAEAAWPEMAAFNRSVIETGSWGECMDFRDQHMVLSRSDAPEDVWLDLNYSPIPDAQGQVVAVLASLRETTDRVLAEKALAKTNEQLAFTLAASGAVGTWDWNIEGDIVTSDRQFAEMYGVDWEAAKDGARLGLFFDGVHPDDRAHLGERIGAAIEAGGEFEAEYRLKGRDGAVRWVLARGRAIHNAAGKAVRLPGVVIDITRRKQSEEALAASEAGFRVLADSMPQMVWSTRPDGFHDYYNARWYEFTGVPAGTTDGEGWNDMFHPDDQERAWALWCRSLETGEPYQIEYRLKHHSGGYRWTLGRALPLRDADGAITRWFGTCTDIHESKRAAEEREVVTQELSHRIKNIFAVLTGIIALSARAYPGMKPFADQLRDRIGAMAKAYEFVRPHSDASGSRDKQSSLRALLEKLVAPFETSDEPRVMFTGDDALVDDASATPLALVIHELATNAAKYGALAVEGGRVNIHGAIEDDNYRLRWREIGGAPIEEPPTSEGFGSRLIRLSAEGQLGGTMLTAWTRDGLDATFVVPLASLNRSSKLQRSSR